MPTHPVQPPEWIDAAPIRVEERVEIAASPDVVWSYIADHERWPDWFEQLDRVEVIGARTGVGGGRRVTARPLTIDEEFTAWDPGAHFAFAVVRSQVPFLAQMAESVRIEPTAAGCRVVYVQGLQAKRGFGPLLRFGWRRAAGHLRTALENLRRRAEAGPAPG